MDKIMTYRKRFAALGMSLVLTASFFTGCNVKKSLPSLKSEEKESEIQSEFDTYTDELFEEEVTLNTIALHYTLADPAAYGINDYEISLGSVTDESLSESVTMLENMRSSLDDFSYPALRDDQQLTYDILDDYLENCFLPICLHYNEKNHLMDGELSYWYENNDILEAHNITDTIKLLREVNYKLPEKLDEFWRNRGL